MGTLARHYWDLDVYKLAFKLQQSIFDVTKAWPKPEIYALTGQVRRSSRAVGANLAEAWAKRHYPAHFLSKLTDCDGELQETRHWLVTAKECAYLEPACFSQLIDQQEGIGRMLGKMIARHDEFSL